MHLSLPTALLLAAGTAVAVPTENPIELFNRAAAGTVITQCTQSGVLALAYDDGPYQYTSELVDILNRAGAKGTFFWTGTLYGCIYGQSAAVQKAFASGHQIASHTWSHSNQMATMSAAQVKAEMTKLEQAFVNLIGVTPAYMRPPYLNTGGQILPVLKELGYSVITDSIDSKDWAGATPAQSESYFMAAGAAGKGNIPLMHETYATTVRVLTPWLINWAKQNNLRIVTVAECLGDQNGMYKQNTVSKNGANTC
ncbi:hypothetical protein TD95_002294 [Thielaviopsis punctulata]|uniref:NodB homology domain-containing protein n=1 Tax=Thielaviopsis punctulata TaxID=72032 RepID=A0A0F4ZBV9_9PEZI|nr:hypothetical protein TD95_002294 [Thielaviopsis punctulata]